MQEPQPEAKGLVYGRGNLRVYDHKQMSRLTELQSKESWVPSPGHRDLGGQSWPPKDNQEHTKRIFCLFVFCVFDLKLYLLFFEMGWTQTHGNPPVLVFQLLHYRHELLHLMSSGGGKSCKATGLKRGLSS